MVLEQDAKFLRRKYEESAINRISYLAHHVLCEHQGLFCLLLVSLLGVQEAILHISRLLNAVSQIGTEPGAATLKKHT